MKFKQALELLLAGQQVSIVNESGAPFTILSMDEDGKVKDELGTTVFLDEFIMNSKFQFHESARGSGRTTKMLEKAINLDSRGYSVYFLVPTKDRIAYLKHSVRFILDELTRKDPNNMALKIYEPKIKFECISSLGKENIDLQRSQLTRGHKNCKLLIDHTVYEHFQYQNYLEIQKLNKNNWDLISWEKENSK